MNHIKIIFLLLTFSIFTNAFSQDLTSNLYSINHLDENHVHPEESSQTVYVCTGRYAYAYHSTSECPGLNNCQGNINYTDESYAANNLKRVPCCRCWSNVGGRCKDDNPSYGGGGGGGSDNAEAEAYIAIAFVIASAALISNDIYLYPSYSFHKNPETNRSSGFGWVFGFRKTFNHSALEYGASVFDRWGGHFNYVHQIYYDRTPENIKIYLGPSLNYVYNFGFGGIIGAEMQLFDRLKLDFRYELTTQTNQLQLGLIFNYQKKYFWKKYF